MKRLPLMRAVLTLLVGFVVLTTAAAQTSTDPNEGSRLTYDSLLGSYDFSWWGQPGRTYFLQHSEDLSAWEYLPLIESGANAPLSWGFTSTASKFFIRLRNTDIPTSNPFNDDFDGDKISNFDEVVLGTDPLSAVDTDSNGLPDDWERFYFGHIGVDPNATAPGGDMTNLQHFALGSNPNNPPPPPIITAATATLDQSADTLLYPADDSQLLIKNGNFSTPTIASNKTWDTYSGITSWTAISGSLIELQKINVNTTAGAGQYCELDSHWPTSDHSGPSDHGIQQTVNLARGRYLLFFDYRGRQTGADSLTAKVKSAGSSTGIVLATKTAASTTVWKRASTTFEVTGGNPNLTTLPVTLLFDIPDAEAKDSYGAYIDNVILLLVDIVPDYNRDGVIDDQDRGNVTEDAPWRWWVNDDSGSGDAEGDSTPAPNPPVVPYFGPPQNWTDTKINGKKDLIDWFPVSLEIGSLIDIYPSASYRYELHATDNSMNIVVPTIGTAGVKLTKSNVRAYLRSQSTALALVGTLVNVLPLTPKTVLTDDFINEVKADRSGVILVEARAATAAGTHPKLELHVINKFTSTDVIQIGLPVKFSGVENMYRNINLLAADNASGGRPSDYLNEPANYPDSLSVNKNFIYLHGYNVNPEQARGWNAEMFKSLFQTGSRAKFYGVTWNGSETQHAGSVTLNYHLNVDNAFATAPALANALAGLQGETTVAAHSLGNMAVSSAIHDWNARIARYFMIDAAVAIEAYDGGAAQEPLMVHEQWSQAGRPADQNYPEQVWATEWHQLSALVAGDNRKRLTWRDRLKNTTQVTAYNFYSSGEEVLADPDATTPGVAGYAGGQLYNIVFGSNPMGEKVWTLQEKLKGRTITGEILGSNYGGWGFNLYWYIQAPQSPPRLRIPAETNSLSDAELVADSFFSSGPLALHNSNGSTYAGQHRNTLLAEMIPARTRSAGSNRVESRGFVLLSGEDRNFNMNAVFQNTWPSGRSSTRWLHSDVNNVGYPFTWKLFAKFAELGELNQ
jgi:hypothetical protein